MNSLLVSLSFYVLVIVLILLNRKKFQIENKVFFLHRTKKGVNLMKKLAKPTLFWTVLSTLFILLAVYFTVVGTGALYNNAVDIITGKVTTPGASFILPGIKLPGGPYLPLLSGIISIIFLAFVHEFSHGIVAFARKVRIKNAGFGFLLPLPIPLAFVEPDEKSMNKARIIDRLRILSAGSGANIVFAFVFMLLGSYLAVHIASSPHVMHEGIGIFNIKGEPLSLTNLSSGDVIYTINGTHMNITTFKAFMSNTLPNQTLVLNTSRGEYIVTLSKDEATGSGRLGGEFRDHYAPRDFEGSILIGLYNLIFWLGLLNMAIGIINFLPVLWITDGCKMLFEFLGYFTKNDKLRLSIANAIIGFVTIILIINIVGPYIL